MLRKILKKHNLILLLLLLTPLLFLNMAEGNSQLVSVKGNQSIDDVGKETLEVLLALKSLKIDISFFEEESFKKLSDFSVDLEEKEQGRENPFEDFSKESSVQ